MRQLEYQERKAEHVRGHEDEIVLCDEEILEACSRSAGAVSTDRAGRSCYRSWQRCAWIDLLFWFVAWRRGRSAGSELWKPVSALAKLCTNGRCGR